MGYKSNKKIYIDFIYYPLKTLGPSERVGIWFQGCDIGCKGCISKHNWVQTDDKLISLKELYKNIKQYNCKKLTISGGEPFNQSEELFELLINIRNSFTDIMIYSGYEYEYLKDNYEHILNLVDVAVTGPFIKELNTNKNYKGSKNQKMYIFNKNLLNIYSEYIFTKKKELQICFSDNEVYLLGIPNAKDTKIIEEILNGEVLYESTEI